MPKENLTLRLKTNILSFVKETKIDKKVYFIDPKFSLVKDWAY